MGVPTAAARCTGPVSPETTSSRAPRASASTSPMPCRRRGLRRAARRLDDRRGPAARSPGPTARATRGRAFSRAAAASSPNRSGGHRLFGQPAPGFSTAYGATPPARRRRHVERSESRRYAGRRPRQARASARFLRITCAPRPDRPCSRVDSAAPSAPAARAAIEARPRAARPTSRASTADFSRPWKSSATS